MELTTIKDAVINLTTTPLPELTINTPNKLRNGAKKMFSPLEEPYIPLLLERQKSIKEIQEKIYKTEAELNYLSEELDRLEKLRGSKEKIGYECPELDAETDRLKSRIGELWDQLQTLRSELDRLLILQPDSDPMKKRTIPDSHSDPQRYPPDSDPDPNRVPDVIQDAIPKSRPSLDWEK